MTFLNEHNTAQRLFINLMNVPQDPRWHPEGSVFNHTARVTAAAVNASKGLGSREHIIAAIFHDIGKLTTTVTQPSGRITAYKHELESINMFDKLINDGIIINNPINDLETIRFIIRNHMRFKVMEEMRPARKQRMINEAESIRGIMSDKGHGIPEPTITGEALIRFWRMFDTPDGQDMFWPTSFRRMSNGYVDCTKLRRDTQKDLNRSLELTIIGITRIKSKPSDK